MLSFGSSKVQTSVVTVKSIPRRVTFQGVPEVPDLSFSAVSIVAGLSES